MPSNPSAEQVWPDTPAADQQQGWEKALRGSSLDDRRQMLRAVSAPGDRQTDMLRENPNPRGNDYRAAGARASLQALRDTGEGRGIVDRVARLTGKEKVLAAAEQSMRQAYTLLWEQAEEVVEEACLGFFTVATLVFGPLATGIFLARLLATLFDGFGRIGFRGFSVPRVAGLTYPMGPVHAGKTMLIFAWTAVLWLFVGVMLYFLTHPDAMVRLGICTIAPAICKSATTTSVTSVAPIQ